MQKRVPGIMIAAVKSGDGKTTMVCALLEALRQRGLAVGAFKCGPDYIDPLFHRQVLGLPSHNLDIFFVGEKKLRELYGEWNADREIAVVEGVMGIFDGMGGISQEGSAYHIASALNLPIVLVTDAHGIGGTLLPLLSGILGYDREKRIAGIVLNRTSQSFYQRIAPVIESELGVPVLGFLPKKSEAVLESRHLGLKLPEEIEDIKRKLHVMAETLEAYVPVDKLLEIAEGHAGSFSWEKREEARGKQVRIGVARDEAFCFYYEENLKLLEERGAELVFFSPLHDRELPHGLDGILLGGGYPELYAEKLAGNVSMRESVRRVVEDGMPSLAECGGFMYLHAIIGERALAHGELKHHEMCGVLPGQCTDAGKPVRFGYLELEEKTQNFLRGGDSVKGHEFHYYDSTDNGQDCVAKKPAAQKTWECVFDEGDHFWGFPHLYYPSNPDFVTAFIGKAKAYRERGSGKLRSDRMSEGK